MYRRQILNEWDKKIMEFLSLIKQNGNQITKKEIAARMSLTRPTLIKLVADIQAIFERMDGYQLLAANNDYRLAIAANQSIHSVFLDLLRYSRKYKILLELFEHESINSQIFCDTNNISVSTYYAELKELNQLLQEFNLVIRNNQLQGAEFQIRHFFVSLFFNCSPFAELEQLSSRYVPQRFIEDLDLLFRIRVNKRFIHEMGLYFYVLQQRHRNDCGQVPLLAEALFANTYDRSSQQHFLEALSRSRILDKMERILTNSGFAKDPVMQKNEQVLLVLFFMSHHFSSYDSLLFSRLQHLESVTGFSAVAIAGYFKKACHAEDSKNRQILYNLSKSVWRHLILKGAMDIEQDLVFYKYRQDLQVINEWDTFQQVVSGMQQQFPGFFYGDAADDPLIGDLGRMYLYFLGDQEATHKIGIYYVDNQLLAKQMTDFYRQELNKYSNISAQPWDEAYHYDLVVTNYESPELLENSDNIYLLNLSSPLENVKYILQMLKNNG